MKFHPVRKRMPMLLFAFLLMALPLLVVLSSSRLAGAEGEAFSCDQIPALECEALESLYLKTNGDAWISRSGWLNSTTPCSWFGISCDADNGHITEIVLTGNNLEGTIPVEIGNLSELIWLDLGANNLTGPIPLDLTKLTKLRTLYLAGNSLTGYIPYQIGHLSELELLYLNRNSLEGTIPNQIGDLRNLQFLYLDGSQLSGAVPDSLCGIDTLVAASIGYNMLRLDGTENCISGLDSVSAASQTIPPGSLEAVIPVAAAAENYAIELTWDPINYSSDPGFYEIFISSVSGGPYELRGRTLDKSVSSHTVRDLEAGVPYYFVVRTITNPSPRNQNMLVSPTSSEVSGTPNALTLTNFAVDSEFSPVAALFFIIALVISAAFLRQINNMRDIRRL